jgi:hypothetical protein
MPASGESKTPRSPSEPGSMKAAPKVPDGDDPPDPDADEDPPPEAPEVEPPVPPPEPHAVSVRPATAITPSNAVVRRFIGGPFSRFMPAARHEDVQTLGVSHR